VREVKSSFHPFDVSQVPRALIVQKRPQSLLLWAGLGYDVIGMLAGVIMDKSHGQ